MKKLFCTLCIAIWLILTLCACAASPAPNIQKGGEATAEQVALGIVKSAYTTYQKSSRSGGTAMQKNERIAILYANEESAQYYLYDFSDGSPVLTGTYASRPSEPGTLRASYETMKGLAKGVYIYVLEDKPEAETDTDQTEIETGTAQTDKPEVETDTEQSSETTEKPKLGPSGTSALSDAKYALKIYMNNIIDSGTPIQDNTVLVVKYSETEYYSFIYKDGGITANGYYESEPEMQMTRVSDELLLAGVPDNVSIYLP